MFNVTTRKRISLPKEKKEKVEEKKEKVEEKKEKVEEKKEKVEEKKEKVEEKIKSGLRNGCSLYPHQEKIVQYMREVETKSEIHGGLICASMGMGKTFSSLYYSLTTLDKGKTLVVASKSILGEWINEYNKFFQGYQVLVLHRDFIGAEIDSIDRKRIDQADIIFTTYETVMKSGSDSGSDTIGERFGVVVKNPKTSILEYKNRCIPPDTRTEIIGIPLLHQYPWHRVIVDEIQSIANLKTVRFISMLALYAGNRWGLTGTPIRNSDQDMWSILKFLGYKEISSPKNWRYQDFMESKQLQNMIFKIDYNNTQIEIPEKKVYTYSITMDSKQEKIYRHFFTEIKDSYQRFLQKNKQEFARILGLFIRLRQICNAPYLVTHESKRKYENLRKVPSDINSLEDWILSEKEAGIEMPKIQKIKEIIQDVISKNEKILIYSSFVSCLDLIVKAIKTIDPIYLKDTEVTVLDGSVTGTRRLKSLESFRKKENCRILLSNYKVGAEGINLTEANHVICVEPWWTPTVENQAISRAWRIGQRKIVHVYRIIVNCTIEIPIINMGKAKESILRSYLDLNANDRIPIPKLDRETIGQILNS